MNKYANSTSNEENQFSSLKISGGMLIENEWKFLSNFCGEISLFFKFSFVKEMGHVTWFLFEKKSYKISEISE